MPPRLLLSLKCLLHSASCGRSYYGDTSVCCAGSRQVLFEPGGILFPGSGWRVLRAQLLQHRESGFSCALLLLVVMQSHLVLLLRCLLGWVVLLLLPLLCPARPAVSSVRRPHDPAGVAVAHPAMRSAEHRRSVRGVGLLPLVLFLAAGRGPIGHPPSLRRLPEPSPLLPELDMRLEVLLAIFAPLRRVTARLVLDLRVGRRANGALSLGCWSSIPLAFGCGG